MSMRPALLMAPLFNACMCCRITNNVRYHRYQRKGIQRLRRPTLSRTLASSELGNRVCCVPNNFLCLGRKHGVIVGPCTSHLSQADTLLPRVDTLLGGGTPAVYYPKVANGNENRVPAGSLLLCQQLACPASQNTGTAQ